MTTHNPTCREKDTDRIIEFIGKQPYQMTTIAKVAAHLGRSARYVHTLVRASDAVEVESLRLTLRGMTKMKRVGDYNLLLR